MALANKSNTAKGSKQKVVKREMCSMLTKGALVDPELIGTPCISMPAVEGSIAVCCSYTAHDV